LNKIHQICRIARIHKAYMINRMSKIDKPRPVILLILNILSILFQH